MLKIRTIISVEIDRFYYLYLNSFVQANRFRFCFGRLSLTIGLFSFVLAYIVGLLASKISNRSQTLES